MATVIVAQILVSFDTHRPGDLVAGIDEATATAWGVKGLARIAVGIDPAEAVTDGQSENTDDVKPSRRPSRSKTGNGRGDATLPAAGGEQG